MCVSCNMTVGVAGLLLFVFGIRGVAARVFQSLEIPLVKEKRGRREEKAALKHLKSLSSLL